MLFQRHLSLNLIKLVFQIELILPMQYINLFCYLLKDNWPHNALELAEVMFKAFSDVAKSNYGRGNATPAQFAMQVSVF